jgi:AraC family transcriptional regulator
VARRAKRDNLASVFDSPDFDLEPYAHSGTEDFVRRTYCSWDEAGWRSLLVQRFTHRRQVDHLPLPGVSDLHLVLCTAGSAEMRVYRDGKPVRRRWAPGRLELMVPRQPTVWRYCAKSVLQTVQVHIPWRAVAQAADQLGVRPPDFEAVSAHLSAGDALVEHVVRSLPAARDAGDGYAESAAAFLAVHLLTQGQGQGQVLPGPERVAVRKAVAVMRDRLADPLMLADIAAEVHLSVYHFIRVFREATGETPHRFLTRLRVEQAQRLLADTSLTLAQIADRCGFSSPAALSSAFLAQAGVRPSAYRKISPDAAQSGAFRGSAAQS